MRHYQVYYKQIGTNNIPSKWPTLALNKKDAEKKFWSNHSSDRYVIEKIIEA